MTESPSSVSFFHCRALQFRLQQTPVINSQPDGDTVCTAGADVNCRAGTSCHKIFRLLKSIIVLVTVAMVDIDFLSF